MTIALQRPASRGGRLRFVRGAVLGALLILGAAVQLALPAVTSSGYAAPYPVPALVFGAAALGGPHLGAWAGLGAGAVLDLAPPAEHPMGQWAFVLAVCGAALGLALRRVRHWVWYLPGAAVGAAVAQLLFTGVGLALGDVHARTDQTLNTLPAVVAWTVGCLLLLLPVLRRLIRTDPSPAA
jgi:rod shape-determining protein MreD